MPGHWTYPPIRPRKSWASTRDARGAMARTAHRPARSPSSPSRRSPRNAPRATPGSAALRFPTAHKASGTHIAHRRRQMWCVLGGLWKTSHGRSSRSSPSTSSLHCPSEHEEHLLPVLGVVEAVRLARHTDADLDAELRKRELPAFETAVRTGHSRRISRRWRARGLSLALDPF